MKNFGIKDNRGSALIFTILILFILSVLGSVLISVAMKNFKLTRHGNDYDTVYHLADGGADEVRAEISILTTNAEFEALSHMSAHADEIKGDYKTPIPDTDPVGYTSDPDDFIDEMKLHYETLYLDYLIDNMKIVVEDEEFSPDIKSPFDDASPVETVLKSDISGLSDGDEIEILVTGKYNNMQRDILLTYKINVPEYICKGSDRGSFIHYDGFDHDDEGANFELVSWKETNINE